MVRKAVLQIVEGIKTLAQTVSAFEGG